MAFASLWVQLFLALGWTVYVIFLPQLAAQAGIAKELVPWLLLADQAIFAPMDWTPGAMWLTAGLLLVAAAAPSRNPAPESAP